MKKKDPTASPKPRRKSASSAPTAKPRKRAAKIKKAVETPAIPTPRVDYPQESERITSPGYTLRIDAPQDGLLAEVSIDDGAWQPCRASVGFWWFDWSGFGSGEHTVKVRLVSQQGRTSEAPARRCVVEL